MRNRHHKILLLLLQFELPHYRPKNKYSRDNNKGQEKKPLTQVLDAICFSISNNSMVNRLVKKRRCGTINGSTKLLQFEVSQ